MDEVIKSIKAYLYDRTVSPLFGAYVLAWSVWNYKIFIVLIGEDQNFQNKLDYIDKYFGPVIHIVKDTLYIPGWFYHGIFWPVVLTFLYLYAYPKIAKPVYEQSLKDSVALRKIKQEAENQRLLSFEESMNLMAEIEQLRLKSESDAKSHRERITALTERIKALDAENAELKLGRQLHQDSEATKNNQKITDLANLLPTKKIDRPSERSFSTENINTRLSEIFGIWPNRSE